MTEKRSVSSAGHEPRPGQVTAGPPQRRSAVVAFALLLGGAAASMFLVGHAEQGNLGVFLLCAGAAMIGCPPLARVKPGIALTATAFLGCSALALLPARLFHLPAWRQAFAAAPDLPLPETVSVAPEQTIFWLAVLTVTILTGLFALTQPLRSKALLHFALAGAGVCGLYAALSILSSIPNWIYPFSSGDKFGFFPNRNHTATLLVTGSVVSIGILGAAFRQRRRFALNAAVAALTLCAAGLLFFSESRGGVVFLLVGAVGWLAGLGVHRNRRLLVAMALVALLGGGTFLTLKSAARDRLLYSVPLYAGEPANPTASAAEGGTSERQGGEITPEDRLRIYRDTLGMIRDVPLTGTGLGTFSLVFAPYRLASANGNQMLHPESDWLMVAAETGLPALICLGGLLVLVFRGWHPAREHPYWPLRWGLMVAAAAAALHGCVDVPIHRAALGWWVLVLAALALQPGRTPETGHGPGRSGQVARVFFVIGGFLAVLLGGSLIRAEWLGGPALPPYFARMAQAKVANTFKRGDLSEATEQARQAIKASPLVSPLYYQLGVLLIREEDTDAEIDRAFRIQRLLSPWTPLTPRLQAVVWMPLDPPRSVALFVEALERQEHVWKTSSGAMSPAKYWKTLVEQTEAFPLVQNLLWDTGMKRDAEFPLVWLEIASPQNVLDRLPRVAVDEALLARFDAGQRQRLAAVWKTKGDPATLQAFLEAHGEGWAQ